MAKAVGDILALLAERKNTYGPLHAAAADVTAAYEGDLAIPLPEMDRDEKRAVPNLLAQGLNQLSMRISSIMPDVFYPPEKPGVTLSEKNARIRRQANLGWWEHSNLKLLMGRRSRHLLGYATSPVVIRPDFKLGIPTWQHRHPLHTFPAQTTNPDDVNPGDCIFTYKRTLGWLRRVYPTETAVLAKGVSPSDDVKFELVEYLDDQETVLAVIGQGADRGNPSSGSAPFAELERLPNRSEMCPAVVPGRITLDKRMGAFDGMVGLYQRAGRLMALDTIAVEMDVFADEWLVARPGETPRVIQMADGRRGVMGIVQGGEPKSVHNPPGYRTDQALAMLERAQRLEAGIPAEMGGEAASNIRTGRRGDQVFSAVVDFPVQEAQRIFEVSLEHENRVAVAQAKAYFGDQPKSFYVSWRGAKGNVDYTPNRHFTTDANQVSYSHTGSDVNSLTVGVGQMIGTGLLSKQSGRELHPMIADPELEHERTISEGLEAAVLSSIQQGAVSGQIAPADVAKIMGLVLTGKSSLEEAVTQVHEEAQARQATQGAPGTPEGPVAPGAPQAQPGIGAPGSSAPAGAIGPTQNEQGLAGLVAALHGGARAVA